MRGRTAGTSCSSSSFSSTRPWYCLLLLIVLVTIDSGMYCYAESEKLRGGLPYPSLASSALKWVLSSPAYTKAFWKQSHLR
mmetsp:Transcript_22900/g.63744  ORF Transcript_22900/g.63744 Transcript_22900/m.63744 type:complete len:81 (+) Transcript_22900:182-424(+)